MNGRLQLALAAAPAVLVVIFGLVRGARSDYYISRGQCKTNSDVCGACSIGWYANESKCKAVKCDSAMTSVKFCEWTATASEFCLVNGSASADCSNCKSWTCNGDSQACYPYHPVFGVTCRCDMGGGDNHAGGVMTYNTCTGP
jgi:hypothetical protein